MMKRTLLAGLALAAMLIGWSQQPGLAQTLNMGAIAMIPADGAFYYDLDHNNAYPVSTQSQHQWYLTNGGNGGVYTFAAATEQLVNGVQIALVDMQITIGCDGNGNGASPTINMKVDAHMPDGNDTFKAASWSWWGGGWVHVDSSENKFLVYTE